MSTLEDLLNDDSSDEGVLPSSSSAKDLKSLDIDDLLDMKDDDEEDDPAVLSSAIYEQFSHLMKTNENIQRELATATSTGSSPTASPGPFAMRKISTKFKDGKEDDEDFLKDVDSVKMSSTDILQHLVESEEDNDEIDDASPREGGTLTQLTGTPTGIAALKNTELKELRALQFSDQTAVSALQIRRSSSVTAGAAGSSTSSTLAGAGAGAMAGGAVMTGMEEMSLITNQLKKNASYQQHGPGIATCLALCPKFLALGTIKGFVLIFDHHQEIRKVLTHPNPAKLSTVNGSSTGVPAMAVVALDALSDGSMIVTAHRCGEIIFWDCTKGIVLKQMRDPSNAEIVSLRLLRAVATQDPRHTSSLNESDTFHAIVLTASSVINRFKLSKSMLSTWHCEIDCLLDESSGQVGAWAILTPFSSLNESSSRVSSNESQLTADALASTASTVSTVAPSPTPTPTSSSVLPSSASLSRFYSDLRQQRGVVQLFAFSFPSQTCVVQSSPDVRILFKWPNTNYPLYESKDSRESLDWTWMFVPFDLSVPSNTSTAEKGVEGMVCAVLTRARETFIDLLVLRVKRTASSQVSVAASSTGGGGGGSSRGAGGGRSSILMLMGNALTGATASAQAEDVPPLSFECLPWLNRSIPNQFDHLLAIKWIKSNQLLAFTKTEVLLFDAGLNLLERCLLLPAISNGFIATIDRQNSSTTEIRPDVAILNNEGYLLTSTACFKLFTKSPFEQANSLINSGRWLEGLSLIVENIGKSPSLLTSEAEHIRRYIINYTLLAVKRTGGVSNAGGTDSPNLGRVAAIAGKHSRNHYHLVASVCTEYCVATRQLGLLFNEILDVFRIEGVQDVLLESLEPFILSRHLSSLPPHILLSFFQMGVALQKLPQIERCLIALKPRDLFFPGLETKEEIKDTPQLDELVTRLFHHKLFSAFLYYFSRGKEDFVGAVQLMFQFLLLQYHSTSDFSRPKSSGDDDDFHKESDIAISDRGLANFEDEEERRELFYKLFLFVFDVFEGKIFPTSEPVVPTSLDEEQDLSFPFTRPSASPAPDNASSPSIAVWKVAKVVHGFQVNAMWSLLNLLTTQQMPSFLSLSSADSQTLRARYEQHALASLEFPLLCFFARFDHVTLFQILLKGFEHLIALFVSSPSAKEGSTNTEPHFSSYHHLRIEGSGADDNARDLVEISRDVVPLSTRQKNEAKIYALLLNLFLFVKEEKERAESDAGLSSRVEEDDRHRAFAYFFQHFPPLLLRLTNAVIAPDFLYALIAYHSSAQLKKSSSTSAKKSEELLRAVIENQLKLLLTSSSSGGISKKFTVFSEKLLQRLSEGGFHWTAFLVRKYHLKLFVALTASPSNAFTPQLRRYLDLLQQRRDLSSNTLKSAQSHSFFLQPALQTSRIPTLPAKRSQSSEGGGDEGEVEDVQEVLFAFIVEGLEYFERERVAVDANTNNASSTSSDGWSLQAVEQLLTKFREAVLEVIIELLELSVEKTIDRIVLPYFLSPQSVHALTEASRKNATLQFKALHYLIVQLRQFHDQNNTSFHIKHYFINQDLLHFLRLHCNFSPDHLLSFLKQHFFRSTSSEAVSASATSHSSSSTRASDVFQGIGSVNVAVEENFPLDEMANVLREFPQISDGIAFFEEKFGRIEEALTILLRDFSSKLKSVRKEVDSALRTDSSSSRASITPAFPPSSSAVTQLLLQVRSLLSSSRMQWHKSMNTPSMVASTSSSSSSTSQLQQLMADMALQLTSCRALRYSLSCISDLCERQSPAAFSALSVPSSVTSDSPIENTPYQRELAEKLWCKAFDHLLNERQLLKEVTMSSSSQIASHFLMHMLQEFMNKMKVVISSQEIISRVLNHSSNSTSSGSGLNQHQPSTGSRGEAAGKSSIVLGEFKEIMENMLQSNAAELLLFQNMKKILHNDVRSIHQQKIRKKRAFIHRSELDETTASIETASLAAANESSKTIDSWKGGSSGPRRSSSRSKPFRLKDVKSMANRAHEKLIVSLPRTTLPTNLSDFSLNFEERRPGQLERKARFSVQIDVPTPWQ